MKQILLCAVSLLCVLLLVACSNEPAGPVTGGPSSGVTTEHVDDPVPAVTDYRYSVTDGKATIVSYVGPGGEITIPETLAGYPVAAIGAMAFANNDNVTSVTIPGSFGSTGYLAFYGCKELTAVVIGEGTTEVGTGCFNECKKLASVSLPDTIETIGMGAFKGCDALQTIDLKNVVYVRDAAFCDSGLVTVTMPASVKESGENTFSQCESLKSATWLSSCFLDDRTFSYCFNLETVDLSGNPSRIYDSSFRRCYALKEIVIPASVDRIYADAFYGCTGLEKVWINNPNISRFYTQCFHWLPSLTDVYFAGSETQWKSIDNYGENEALELATLHFEG